MVVFEDWIGESWNRRKKRRRANAAPSATEKVFMWGTVDAAPRRLLRAPQIVKAPMHVGAGAPGGVSGPWARTVEG